jgi:hypothetical protein
MLHVVVQDQQTPNGCVQCCCSEVSLKAGEIQPLYLNYAPWAAPIAGRGLHCSPSITIEEKDTCPPPLGGDLPPRKTGDPVYFCAVGGHLDGDLNLVASDPEGKPLTFKVLPMYGPKQGKLVLAENGMFDYDPFSVFKGYDRFFYSASDGVNELIAEVLIGIGVNPTVDMMTPVFSVGQAVINAPYYTVVLPLIASPAALPCQIFRLTIRQGALSCECDCYYHIDCVDVRISKC